MSSRNLNSCPPIVILKPRTSKPPNAENPGRVATTRHGHRALPAKPSLLCSPNLSAANTQYQGRDTTRQEVDALTILLACCAKKKLAWEKQIASLQKRVPTLMESMSAIISRPRPSAVRRIKNQPVAIPAKRFQSAYWPNFKLLREIQGMRLFFRLRRGASAHCCEVRTFLLLCRNHLKPELASAAFQPGGLSEGSRGLRSAARRYPRNWLKSAPRRGARIHSKKFSSTRIWPLLGGERTATPPGWSFFCLLTGGLRKAFDPRLPSGNPPG